MRLSSELQFDALWEVVARERQGALCRGKPGLSGEYVPDLARAEGSSIVDETEEC